MQDIELLKERSRLYKPLYNSLKKKNIKYNEYLILGEIFINLKDQLKIKNLVSRYILDSIKSFHDKKIKYSTSIIKKYEPEILALPNITPNGVIVPKKENNVLASRDDNQTATFYFVVLVFEKSLRRAL